MTEAAWQIPDNETIRTLLRQRLDVEREGVGIVVGVIDGRGQRVVAHGVRAEGEAPSLDGETVFEIGSISKVFTALALADMAERGEVSLDDPVAKHLPAGFSVPTRGGREITLTDLATHTSGLPRRPGNMPSTDWATPYAGYTAELLRAFLAGYRLRRETGGDHLYSNLGMGLLGYALAFRAGTDFEALIRERITHSLDLEDTAITLTPSMQARLAAGHDIERRVTPNWDLGVLAGAGGLRSTANDLLRFLAAELGFTETPLAAAMAAQMLPRRPKTGEDQQGLGWVVSPDSVGEIVWHGGQSGGYRSFLLFNRARRAGVVMLSNSAVIRNDDLPFHLLSGRPLTPAAPTARAPLARTLERYVGRYRLATGAELEVTRDGRRLFAQMTRQPAFEIFAQGRHRFVWKVAVAEARFHLGPDGRANRLVLRQSGREMPAERVS